MKFDGDGREWYFILVEEWLTSAESGRDVLHETYDTLEEAQEAARTYLDGEREVFSFMAGVKATPPGKFGELTYVMTPEEGQEDEWYYCVKIVPIAYGMAPITGFRPEMPKGL
jgi:hypothetical protein